MKSKSIFTLLCSIIFTLCLCSVAFANNAKTEAIKFLKQATQNTVNTQNAAYSIDLSMTGPLADCNIKLNGNYAYPVFTNGDMSLLLNLWIVDTSFKANTQYYTELDGNVYKQYFKTQTEPKLDNDNSGIKSDQWYVQSIKIPEDFIQNYKKEMNNNVDDIDKDIKNIFMYDANKNTTKIYVTYNKALLDEDKLNQALSISDLNSKEMQEVNEFYQKINENKQLKEALTKQRELSYEITIDKKNMRITSVNADLSPVIYELGTDILNNISDEKLSVNGSPINGATVRNIIKNYLERSKFNMTIQLSKFNTSPVETVPQEVKDSAIAPPKIEKIGEATDTTDILTVDTATDSLPTLEVLGNDK